MLVGVKVAHVDERTPTSSLGAVSLFLLETLALLTNAKSESIKDGTKVLRWRARAKRVPRTSQRCQKHSNTHIFYINILHYWSTRYCYAYLTNKYTFIVTTCCMQLHCFLKN